VGKRKKNYKLHCFYSALYLNVCVCVCVSVSTSLLPSPLPLFLQCTLIAANVCVSLFHPLSVLFLNSLSLKTQPNHFRPKRLSQTVAHLHVVSSFPSLPFQHLAHLPHHPNIYVRIHMIKFGCWVFQHRCWGSGVGALGVGREGKGKPTAVTAL